MIGDLAQSVRTIVRAAAGMSADSVRPEDQIAGVGGQIDHLATVKITMTDDLGWPAITYENVDGTPTSRVNENVDQLIRLTASVNFYRGGNASSAGIAEYTTRAVDDAARLAHRLKLTSIGAQMNALGLFFVGASQPRDLTALLNGAWRSRGQIDLRFYVVNRESEQVNSIGSGELVSKRRDGGREITITTEVTT